MSSFVPFSFQYKFNLEIIFSDANAGPPRRARSAYPVRVFLFRERIHTSPEGWYCRSQLCGAHSWPGLGFAVFSPIRLTGQNNYPNMETMKCRIGIFFRWSADKAWMKRWGHKSASVRWWLHAAVDGYILWCRCLSRNLVPNFAHSWKSWMNSLGTFYRSCDICANS